MVSNSTERLAMLYQISQELNSSLDLNEVLNRAMDQVIAATRAERGFLMLVDPSGQLEFKAARGIAQHVIEAPEFQVSRGIVERVAREGRPLLTSDAQTEAWLRAGQCRGTGPTLDPLRSAPSQGHDHRRGVRRQPPAGRHFRPG